MIPRFFIAAILAAVFVASPAYSEPAADRLIGKVNIRNPAKLDAQTKKELATLAAKIKKIKPIGTIKVIGDVPSAESQDEYLLQSVFIARIVETQLKTLLSKRHQIFITASKFSSEKRVGQNSVEIYIYPYELKVEGAGFSSSQITSEVTPRMHDSVQDQPSPRHTSTAILAQPPVYSGLLTPALDDSEQIGVTSKKERQRAESEDYILANDLVIKAKSRAAEKAKRLEREK